MFVLFIFTKIHASVVFSVPLGVRGPLRAPSGRPRGSPLGLPWPLLRPRRTTQPTVVINVRSASLFGQNGPGAREGCTFLETLCFLVFSKIHPPPLGAPAAAFKDQRPKGTPKQHPGPKRSPKKNPQRPNYAKKDPQKGPGRILNTKYQILN